MRIDVKHKDSEGNDMNESMTVFILKCSIYSIMLAVQVLGVYLIWNSTVVEIFPTIKQIDAIQACLLLCLVQLFRAKI